MKKAVLLNLLMCFISARAISTIAQTNSTVLPFNEGQIFKYMDSNDSYWYNIKIYDVPEYEIKNSKIIFSSNPRGAIINGVPKSITFYPPPSGQSIIPETVEYNGYTINIDSISKCPTRCLKIQLSKLITTIPDKFSDCTSLSSDPYRVSLSDILLSKKITRIGKRAFKDCEELSIRVWDSYDAHDAPRPKIIDDEAFSGCEEFRAYPNLLSEVEYIGTDAFYKCIIDSIALPKIKTICSNAFLEAKTNQSYLIIPESCDSIGDCAFSETLIKNVIISSTNPRLGVDIFRLCENLESVKIPDTWKEIPDGFLTGCSALTECNIPYGIEYIGNNAFSKTKLSSIKLPDSIKKIGDGAFASVQLENLELPNSITYIWDGAFRGCEIQTLKLPESVTAIGNEAFRDCKIQKLILPESLTSIGDRAFAYSDIKELILPESLTSIGDGAFAYSDIKEIKIPESVTKFGDNVFAHCNLLKEVSLPSHFTHIPDNCFEYCRSLKTLNLPTHVKSIGKRAFYTCIDLSFLQNDVVLPQDIEQIGDGAFAFCPIKSISLPAKLTEISSYLFYCCTLLKSVYIPDGVTKIGSYAFSGSPNITDIYLRSEEPPTAENRWIFDDKVFKNATLHLPDYTLYRYFFHPIWSNFNHFDDPCTGVTDITADSSGPEIITSADGVTITGADGMPVNAYTTDGRLMFNSQAYDGSALPLPHGSIYIITVGPKHIKVRR